MRDVQPGMRCYSSHFFIRLRRLLESERFEFSQIDIADAVALKDLAQTGANGQPPRSFDAVLNLAARAGVRQSVENPWVYAETNITGTLNLLELCRSLEIKKFVLASTSSLYGAGNQLPYHEEANTERVLSPYAATKKAAEALCYTYHYLYGIDVTVFRYFTVYGPAGRPDMSLFRFVQWIHEGHPVKIYGDGSQSRDFTYVDDIARGTILGLKPLGYEVVNLGSDKPVVLSEAVRSVEDLAGRKAQTQHTPRHPADVPATWAAVGKAERLLGWRPQWSFESGVRELVSWYQANREWASEIETSPSGAKGGEPSMKDGVPSEAGKTGMIA